jgi:hypothetical protein
MIKPTTRRVLRHITAWTLYFAYEFLGYFDRLAHYTPIEWVETVFNCLSLMAVVYISLHCSRKFFDAAPSYRVFLDFSPADKQTLLTNKYLLRVLVVILAYMGLSFWLDNEFFGMGYKEIVLQLKMRSRKVLGFAAVGIIYGYHKVQKMDSRELKQRLEIANWRVRIYQDTTNYIRTLLDKLNVN